jgi:hypothetical protein
MKAGHFSAKIPGQLSAEINTQGSCRRITASSTANAAPVVNDKSSIASAAPSDDETARRSQIGIGATGTPACAWSWRLRTVSGLRIIANTMTHRGGFGNHFGSEAPHLPASYNER